MALRESDGHLGPPWRRPLRGVLDQLVVDSELLAENPLGDSARRPLYVYRSRAVAAERSAAVPAVYMLQGFSGQLDTWLARKAFEPTVIERLDEMFAAGGCPDALVVFVDAWTARGGSQFLNSSSTGRYMDYICDEVVPFIDARYPTLAEPAYRGVVGGSSGGYGAMVLPMFRPDVFGAFAAISADALFECSYQRAFPGVARTLRDHFEGSYEVLLRSVAEADRFDWATVGDAFEMYGYACAYSPDPARPGEALLPFDLNGRVVDEVWQQWLALDPVRLAPRCADALHSLRAAHVHAGRADEYYLDLGAQAFCAELEQLGLDYQLELFDGTHGGIRYRYPRAIRQLLLALAG